VNANFTYQMLAAAFDAAIRTEEPRTCLEGQDESWA
jgi:hypothetical protein